MGSQYFGVGDAIVLATPANIQEATQAVTGGSILTPTASVTPSPKPPVTVPEPVTIVLLGTGLASLAGYVGYRQQKT